eukprot:11003171-Ditylum_brightwellii.AAC.1
MALLITLLSLKMPQPNHHSPNFLCTSASFLDKANCNLTMMPNASSSKTIASKGGKVTNVLPDVACQTEFKSQVLAHDTF